MDLDKVAECILYQSKSTGGIANWTTSMKLRTTPWASHNLQLKDICSHPQSNQNKTELQTFRCSVPKGNKSMQVPYKNWTQLQPEQPEQPEQKQHFVWHLRSPAGCCWKSTWYMWTLQLTQVAERTSSNERSLHRFKTRTVWSKIASQ